MQCIRKYPVLRLSRVPAPVLVCSLALKKLSMHGEGLKKGYVATICPDPHLLAQEGESGEGEHPRPLAIPLPESRLDQT